MMLGLPSRSLSKSKGNGQHFLNRLSPEDREHLKQVGQKPSLLELLEKWLSRTPFLIEGEFHFWREYRQVVQKMLWRDHAAIAANPDLDEQQKALQSAGLSATIKTFESLFDDEIYREQMAQGKRRLSQKAMLGALFIFLYREQPLLSTPYRLLTSLIDFDEGANRVALSPCSDGPSHVRRKNWHWWNQWASISQNGCR